MPNIAKRAIARTSEFVSDHKTAITIIVTAVVTTAAGVAFEKIVKDGYVEAANEFLEDKGLTAEFVAKYFEYPIN